MDKFVFALIGLVLGFALGWFTFASSKVTEEVKVEETAPVIPAEPEAEVVTPVEEVPLPPQETVEPAPAVEKAAE